MLTQIPKSDFSHLRVPPPSDDSPKRAVLKSNQLCKANAMVGREKKKKGNFLFSGHQRFSWRALMAQLCSTAGSGGEGEARGCKGL